MTHRLFELYDVIEIYDWSKLERNKKLEILKTQAQLLIKNFSGERIEQ